MEQWRACKKVSDDVEFNGIKWEPLPQVEYCWDYGRIWDAIQRDPDSELSYVRQLCQTDLFFLLHFILRVPRTNHIFAVEACRDVQTGPVTNTLDVWAREHLKTSIISIAEPIQRVLNDRNTTIGIFSYAQAPAQSILRSIKQVLEQSEVLRRCFPDVLYWNPQGEASTWSEDKGLIVKRDSFQKESTFEAHGLIDGMPTGKHFKHRVYDDVVTEKSVPPYVNPETMEKVKYAFDLSENLGSEGGTSRVLGTYYHHEDALVYVANKKDEVGEPIYHVRRKPATLDGTFGGRGIFLSDERLRILRTNRKAFNCQQLLDPTPTEMQELSPDMLVMVEPGEVPKRLFKFMTVDFAGVDKNRQGDSWAIHLIGVNPYLDDLGGSEIYLLDSVIEPMDFSAALNKIVQMYSRAGIVWEVGVEKVGATTMEVHVKNALKAKGYGGARVKVLSPSGRRKDFRILQCLEWPLRNGKIKVARSVPVGVVDRLKMEMRRFPAWHDDGLDALAYVYDLLREFNFAKRRFGGSEEDLDRYKFGKGRNDVLDSIFKSKQSWMYV